jgi:lincosamide nucleotidyltransferase A/C/D/E
MFPFHTVTFDADGGGNQELQDGRIYRYAPQGFTATGLISGVNVRCLSPEVQADCHYGYEPGEDDKHDMRLLHAVFQIDLMEPYRDTQNPSHQAALNE